MNWIKFLIFYRRILHHQKLCTNNECFPDWNQWNQQSYWIYESRNFVIKLRIVNFSHYFICSIWPNLLIIISFLSPMFILNEWMILTTPRLSFLFSRSSLSIWFRCSIMSVLSYVYADMSLSTWKIIHLHVKKRTEKLQL